MTMLFCLITLVIGGAVIVLGALVSLGLFYKLTNVKCKSKKRLEGKTVIVTGGTTGMGLEIAIDAAKRGGKVIIACPFQQEGTDARETIVDTTGNTDVTFKLLDLSSLASVREFASDILKTHDRLDILINNAGVLVPDIPTKDGLNFTMQVNYFGHFLLTILLLPLLKKTGKPSEPSRIVNTSSSTHRIGKIDFENIAKAKAFRFAFKNYANSKLCIAMFTRELAKRLTCDKVVVNTADPRAAVTQIGAQSKFIAIIRKFLANFYPNAREGAQTALHIALDEKAGEVTGEYFKNCKVSKPGKNVFGDTMSQLLWDQSIKFVKLSNDELKL